MPRSGSILITRNGKACATLLTVTEDTNLEGLVLFGSKRFWHVIDSAYRRGEIEGWTDLDETRLGND